MSQKKQKGEIKYPLTFDLKVIMTSQPGDNKNVVELDNILDDLSIKLNRNWLSKKSKLEHTPHTQEISQSLHRIRCTNSITSSSHIHP